MNAAAAGDRRVTLVHNRYRSAMPSGENVVVDRERALLEAGGWQVDAWLAESDGLLAQGLAARVRAGWDLAGSGARRLRLREEIARRGAALLHLHNPWPLLTYDLALAARDAGVPLVQTLHNYRLISTNDRLVRGGALRAPRDGAERTLLGRCAPNHGGRLAEFAYRRALAAWWTRRVPQEAVGGFICLTGFQRRLMIEAGVPAGRLAVKPNFLDHRGPVGAGPGDHALFVGRLDALKGVDRLARCWSQVGLPLRVVGSGPLAERLAGLPGVTLVGTLPAAAVQEEMARARFLVMNSTCFEGFPLVLIEALAAGTPCLVPGLGALPEIVTDGVLGRVFAAEDDAALVAQARRLADEAPGMRAACRAAYEGSYTPDLNRARLEELYARVAAGRDIADPA